MVTAFLRRITGQDDLVVGTPVAAREHPDLDRVVGCLTNTVLLRTSLGGDPRFADLVGAVRAETIEAYAHQEYPLDLLVQQLAAERDADCASLVQVVFSMVDPQRPRPGAGVEFSVQSLATSAGKEIGAALPVKFDLLARAKDELDGRLTWVLDFSADLFEAATARRLARRFEIFVADLVSRPDATLSALSLVTDAERDDLRFQRAAGRTEYPLSVSQHETWAQCQLHPGSGLHNAAVDVMLTGPLNIGAFQDAFQAVVDRHEAMRTSFHAPEGTPIQRVEPVRARAVVRDLAEVPAAAHAEHVRARSEALVRQPFTLDRAPLFRAELIWVDGYRHAFLFACHQLILDAFHLPQFLDELAHTYERLLTGDRRPLPPLALQFGDFATWEQRTSAAGLLPPHESYWRRQLRAPLPSMAIAADRQPQSQRTLENGYFSFRLPRELARALTSVKQRYETTTFRMMTAAFSVLLGRLTGESDLLLALPVSTRPEAFEDAVGCFANTLPLRVGLDVDQPFDQLLAAVTAQVRDARARREFPLTAALRKLGVACDPNRPALPICISQIRPFSATAGALHLHTQRVYAAASGFDLWLVVAAAGDDIELGLHYAAELFDAATIAAFARAFEALLASIVARPNVPLRALEILAAEDRLRVAAWGDGGAEDAPSDDVIAQIAGVAARTPDAVAVVAGAARFTHAELHDVARRVAARLRAAEVGREDRVGILGTRSPGMLAAVLGVLQAGAAFVPLEASQPDVRLRAIVAAAGLSAIVADEASLARARELGSTGAPLRVLCWDEPAECSADLQVGPSPAGLKASATTRHRAGAVPVEKRPTDLAYIFYTSGSTGAPKGVMVERGAMLNHLRAKIATLELNASSVVAQNASYGFDIVVWQWLAPLLAGGRVVIYDDATAEDPVALLAALAFDGTTVVETVPSFLEALVEVAERSAASPLPALRWMVSNAEALPPAIAGRWLAQYPTVRLLNTCGATECADDTTHVEVTASDAGRARVPVGRPIPGAAVAVVDELMRPVPPGCVGEIVYGDVVVGRGYVGDPVATARAFVPDPRSAAPGRRLYRTGDRGRWRTDGVLECLGRLDDQVKVRGYRVELGEVEAALATLPELSQVAAAVRTDAHGQPRLVAYYVAQAPCDGAAVRKALATRLPAYMVPDAIVRLAALPRTRTGKLDRAALPPPPEREASGGSDRPETQVEEIVAAVWQDVMQIPFVGRQDNFFDLGGHSLTAIRIVAALKDRLGRHVPIRQLFMTPTVAGLTKALGDAPADRAAFTPSADSGRLEQRQGPPALTRVPDRPWYPISTAQRAHWVMHRMNVNRWYPPRILQLDGALHRDGLGFALQGLVDRHDALRTTFLERDGEVVQVVQDRVEIDVPLRRPVRSPVRRSVGACSRDAAIRVDAAVRSLTAAAARRGRDPDRAASAPAVVPASAHHHRRLDRRPPRE